MKRNILVLLSIIILTLSTSFTWRFEKPIQKPRLKKIIIDAGHGGHDGGAVGKYSKEKEISLGVALKLAKLIEQEFTDIDVVLTRKEDIYQSPPTKANIANYNKGDLFISLHCNSAAPIKHSSDSLVIKQKLIIQETEKRKRNKPKKFLNIQQLDHT